MSDLLTSGRSLQGQTGRIRMMSHRRAWIESARPNQLRPDGDWDIWLALAGRGFGKTRFAGEDIAWDTWQQSNTITHVVAGTHGDLRSVCYEGESGLLNIIPSECIITNGYNKSLGEITLTNGSVIRGYSADAPDRLRGPQCHRLWGDELAAWDKIKGNAQLTFDMALLGLRLGDHARAIFSTTPKPIQLVRNLVNLHYGRINDHNRKLAELRVKLTTGSTHENFSNLSKNFRILISQYEGTRLGRQELYAEVLEDVEGALWNIALIEECRLPVASRLSNYVRVAVSVDPSVTSSANSDECGIVVGGLTEDGFGHVLEDASGKYSPRQWAEKAIECYKRWGADCIIGEINNGGDLVETNLRGVDPNIPFRSVRASRGKVARAEPVASLYEQHKIFHIGSFPRLEDQMTRIVVGIDRTRLGFSPDRVDALTWLFAEMMLGSLDDQGIFEYYRQLAAGGGHMPVKTNISTPPLGFGNDPPEEMKMVKMGSNNPGITDIFDRRGRKYVPEANGTIIVPEDLVPILRKHGFREMETVQ